MRAKTKRSCVGQRTVLSAGCSRVWVDLKGLTRILFEDEGMHTTLEHKRSTPDRSPKFPSFLGMRDAELESLSEHAKLQSYPRNKIVVHEGDRTDSVYVIHSGRV